MEEDGLLSYCQDHFPDFLSIIRTSLNSEQQATLLSYYLNQKPQHILALVFDSTQTVCSFRLRMMCKVVGAYLMWSGPPSEEIMQRILKDAGLRIR